MFFSVYWTRYIFAIITDFKEKEKIFVYISKKTKSL